MEKTQVKTTDFVKINMGTDESAGHRLRDGDREKYRNARAKAGEDEQRKQKENGRRIVGQRNEIPAYFTFFRRDISQKNESSDETAQNNGSNDGSNPDTRASENHSKH